MSNVKSIFGGPTGVAEPNETCVMTLRQYLEMAEAGEIVGVVIAALNKDGCAGYAVSGRVGGYSMAGALEVARDDLVGIIRGRE